MENGYRETAGAIAVMTGFLAFITFVVYSLGLL